MMTSIPLCNGIALIFYTLCIDVPTLLLDQLVVKAEEKFGKLKWKLFWAIAYSILNGCL